jgi:hypothetical protein
MAKLYAQAVSPPDLNKNTEWFMYPGVWTTYILILFVSWLLVLSVVGCTPGMAWTLVNLGHFAVRLPPSLLGSAPARLRRSLLVARALVGRIGFGARLRGSVARRLLWLLRRFDCSSREAGIGYYRVAAVYCAPI